MVPTTICPASAFQCQANGPPVGKYPHWLLTPATMRKPTHVSLPCAAMLLVLAGASHAQNFTFDYSSSGQRACLVSATVTTAPPAVTIQLLDAPQNTNRPTSIYRRNPNVTTWTPVASNLPPGTTSWTDTNVLVGETWEYQVKRAATWTWNGTTYDATGYTQVAVRADRTLPQGRMILVVSSTIANALPAKVARLQRELTADGWFVETLTVATPATWDAGGAVVALRQQIQSLWNAAPAADKPKQLFLLGHVPLPRSGSTFVSAPDEHDENKGARGCDAFYADIDGVYTDTATFNPGGLASPLAVNLPGDFKWDQDFFPSDVEMAFGRVDFRDLTDTPLSEIAATEQYLDRLSNYRNVVSGFFMGNRTAFYFGYDNSNDATYRSLPNLSGSAGVFQNQTNLPHPQWVDQNGPFMVYQQNVSVPDFGEWLQHGMDATVYSSDQSYWGFGDVPQQGSIYSRIRALLAADSKCLVTLWTTTGINTYYPAGAGETIGESFRKCMNHNPTNNLQERPPQAYDTQDWWNRTHFAFYGDPTIRLHQVEPTGALHAAASGNGAYLAWAPSPDPRLMGYHVYRSSAELGPYTRITTTPITTSSYYEPTGAAGQWFMVRAIIEQTTGSGRFLNPSLGKLAQATTGLAGVGSYGSGCAGLGGQIPGIATNGLPTLGNGSFAVSVYGGRANSVAVAVFGDAPAAGVLGSCTLLVAPPWSTLPATATDGAGFGTSSLPVPNNPTLLGATLNGQYLVIDPAGQFLGFGALSDGIALLLGN